MSEVWLPLKSVTIYFKQNQYITERKQHSKPRGSNRKDQADSRNRHKYEILVQLGIDEYENVIQTLLKVSKMKGSCTHNNESRRNNTIGLRKHEA